MEFTGFEAKDFDLFEIEGFQERMDALISQLRPKFYDLGDDLVDDLSEIVGYKMQTHVAKHARRKTNPPNDSWFALADANYRGYKMLPHFQVAVWNSHVIVQWGLIYEAKAKETFGKNMVQHLDEIKKAIPGEYHFFKDHMKPAGTALKDLSDDDLKEYARRLVENKNGELMVGKVITRDEAVNLSPEEFKTIVLETWKDLNYLHTMAQ